MRPGKAAAAEEVAWKAIVSQTGGIIDKEEQQLNWNEVGTAVNNIPEGNYYYYR